MDYITRYYKNLSEQLQAQTNQLKRILTEMEAANLQTLNVEFDATPQGDYNQADSGLQPVMAGRNTGYDPLMPKFGSPGMPYDKNGNPQQGYDPNQRYVIVFGSPPRYFIMTGNPAQMYGPFNPVPNPNGIGHGYPKDLDLGNPYWEFNPTRRFWHAPGDLGDRWSPNRWYR